MSTGREQEQEGTWGGGGQEGPHEGRERPTRSGLSKILESIQAPPRALQQGEGRAESCP